MAAKSWLIGCGSLVMAGIIILVIGGGLLMQRAGTMRHDIADANERYVEVNRDFPFKPPVSGELDLERFARYLKVRQVVASAMAPMQENRGFKRLLAMTELPGEVSRVHVQALRDASMSMDEYRWITRQMYTTLAGEPHRSNPDSALNDLSRQFAAAFRRQGSIRGGAGSSDDPFRAGVLDLTWLRVPESTRAVVRGHADELRNTVDAALADQLFLNIEFRRSSN